MKATIDVDRTPEEARRFVGLPDIAPMQEALVAEMQKHMTESLSAMDPEQMMKTWMPAGMAGLQELQRAFLSRMAAAAGGEGAT